MFEAENIRDWRGHDVVDQDGKKIGELEAIYVDTSTDLPAFSTVRVGFMGRRRLVLVPLHNARVGPGWVKVDYGRGEVKNAPAIGVDGELLAENEPDVFRHYGLDYEAGTRGERRLARR
jgi:hypothetical protein